MGGRGPDREGIQISKDQDKHPYEFTNHKFLFKTNDNYRSQKCPGYWKKRVAGSPGLPLSPPFICESWTL